jgi:hypothetical protein
MLSKLRPTAFVKRLLSASNAGFLTQAGRPSVAIRANNMYSMQYQARWFSSDQEKTIDITDAESEPIIS